MNSEPFLTFLELLNETLTTTIVIVSASILLYNLARDSHDRVTRASSTVLSCVTLVYLADVFLSLEPGSDYLEFWLRIQWIGIAFVPAGLLHLSDALLATTGRPSRGRRRAVVRISYALSLAFTSLALGTSLVINDLQASSMPHMQAGPVFWVYLLYLAVISGFAFINVVRARNRCLTRYTRRRMAYLLGVFLAPIYGTFPYSLLSPLGDERRTTLLIILNLANLVIVMMLVLMAYPLSFFGSEKPDRVIKSQLMEFMLRGPFTGALVLGSILFVPRISNVLGLDGEALMPFAAVAILLFLQWSITLMLPVLRRWLIYTDDQQRAQWIQQLSDRLLTEDDAVQLLESILAAICDHLRVSTAFVALVKPDGAELVQMVGQISPSPEQLTPQELTNIATASLDDPASVVNPDNDTPSTIQLTRINGAFLWQSHWLFPLRLHRASPDNGEAPVIGILGVWARAPHPDLDEEEELTFRALKAQATRVLTDLQRQSEVFVLLEGLASQIDYSQQQLRGVSRYGHISQISNQIENLTTQPEFADWVWDALREYWGGPKLTESELLRLNVVWREMEDTSERNPVRALRAVLNRAIENLKPDGERNLTTTEWILYNILEMRFLQGRKVRDVALRLAMSEADFYRKQRKAIEEVARHIEAMERHAITDRQQSENDADSRH